MTLVYLVPNMEVQPSYYKVDNVPNSKVIFVVEYEPMLIKVDYYYYYYVYNT